MPFNGKFMKNETAAEGGRRNKIIIPLHLRSITWNHFGGSMSGLSLEELLLHFGKFPRLDLKSINHEFSKVSTSHHEILSAHLKLHQTTAINHSDSQTMINISNLFWAIYKSAKHSTKNVKEKESLEVIWNLIFRSWWSGEISQLHGWKSNKKKKLSHKKYWIMITKAFRASALLHQMCRPLNKAHQ